MDFVIFDTEFMADKGLQEEGFDGWKNREVVQIAAIKVSDELEVIEDLNLYIKPKVHPTLSAYFMNLTGLTNELMSKEGIDFPEAYERFRDFVGDLPCYSHGWSLDCSEIGDGEVMSETMAYYGITDDNPPLYKNIAPWFQKTYQEKCIRIEKQASGEIAGLLGLEEGLKDMGIGCHNALYDVYSILAGLRFLSFREHINRTK